MDYKKLQPRTKKIIICVSVAVLFIYFGYMMMMIGETRICRRLGGVLATDHNCYDQKSLDEGIKQVKEVKQYNSYPNRPNINLTLGMRDYSG